MPEHTQTTTRAQCACGQVTLEMRGAPILGAVCYCEDCQRAARELGALPRARPLQDADGGTAYLLYRRDRFQCTQGAEWLQSHKLTPTSPTRRQISTCCGSPLFLDFDGPMHWVSVYHSRIQGKAPSLEMRIYTRSREVQSQLPGDIPSYATVPLRFILKLIGAKLAMLLKR